MDPSTPKRPIHGGLKPITEALEIDVTESSTVPVEVNEEGPVQLPAQEQGVMHPEEPSTAELAADKASNVAIAVGQAPLAVQEENGGGNQELPLNVDSPGERVLRPSASPTPTPSLTGPLSQPPVRFDSLPYQQQRAAREHTAQQRRFTFVNPPPAPVGVKPPSDSTSASSSSAALTNISPCCENRTVSFTTWTLLLGQLMSVCLCGTAIASQLLSDAKFNAPAAQSFLNYFFLAFVYGLGLMFRPSGGEGSNGEQRSSSFHSAFRRRGWKYALLALIDVEANFFIVYAYQYTNLTSIQLLDCFTIPVVMLLSWAFLSVRYLITHITGVAVCLVGIALIIYSDATTGRGIEGSGGESKFFGDILCLVAAMLYGVANVCEEYLVKQNDRFEYLGFVGLFGSIISGIQLSIFEHSNLAHYQWTSASIGYYLLFTACMFAFYSLVSVVMQRSSALMFNLQVLTSDFYVLMAGAFLFRYSFQSLYLVSFVAVIAGSVIYSVQRTREKSKREVSCFKRFVACLCPWVPLCCGDDWLPTPPPREYTVHDVEAERSISTGGSAMELRSEHSSSKSS